MDNDKRFQMRCNAAFLDNLDRLKEAFGVRTRPEAVRIAIRRTIIEYTPTRVIKRGKK